MAKQKKIPRNVWVLGFVSLLTDASSEMIYVVLPMFLVNVLGADVLTVGTIEGIAEATASIVKVISGSLSDYLKNRKILTVIGYGLSTAVKPLFALATNPGWILLARFGDRVGKGIRGAPRDALVADSTEPELRGAAYGLRQSLDSVGAFIGPLLAFVLLSFLGENFRQVFVFSLIPGILSVVLLIVGVQEPKSTTISKSKTNPLNRQSLKKLSWDYWIVVIVALLFNLGNSSDAFLLLKAQQVGIATPLIPLTIMVMNIVYSISAYPVGLLSDRIGRFGLLLSSFLLYAFIYLGFALVQTSWLIWILFAFYGLYLGMSQGILLAMVAERVPATLRGTAFGFFNLATGTALLPASLLGGWLWKSVGSSATFFVGSLFALVATLFLAMQNQKN